MRNKYYLVFSKQGFIRYTSHLDMLRLFKRAFKKVDIPLDYSQGYNPHPKLGFAQPLSLGYTSSCEYVEFETKVPVDMEKIKKNLNDVMARGIEILEVGEVADETKSFAARMVEATYTLVLPFDYSEKGEEIAEILAKYMNQEEILANKRKKKTKKLVKKNIKPMIRELNIGDKDGQVALIARVDSGSISNLNPDLIVESFIEFSGLDFKKYEVETNRDQVVFSK